MHSSVRPEVVLLLTTLDLNHPDTRQRPYHRDGRPFTRAERDLLITFTPEEKAAAIAQIELEDEWQRELDEMKDAFVDLLMKYFAKLPEGSVVSDAVTIMTDEGLRGVRTPGRDRHRGRHPRIPRPVRRKLTGRTPTTARAAGTRSRASPTGGPASGALDGLSAGWSAQEPIACTLRQHPAQHRRTGTEGVGERGDEVVRHAAAERSRP